MKVKNNYLQECSTNKWKFVIDRSTTKYVSSTKWQRNMLDHLSKKLKCFSVAHEVKGIVYCTQVNEYVLKIHAYVGN